MKVDKHGSLHMVQDLWDMHTGFARAGRGQAPLAGLLNTGFLLGEVKIFWDETEEMGMQYCKCKVI